MKWTVLGSAFVFALSVDAASAERFRLRSAGDGEQIDCAKAQSAVEKLICADAGLRELDEYLGRYYAAARSAVGSGASCVQTDQMAWLKATRGACRDAGCLKKVYLDRLAELDPLQPGATAIKNIELPPVPALMWVIGPASDKVAAPGNPKAMPFETTGMLLNEVTTGDGFVLETSDGAKLALAMVMFLEGETSQRLAAMAKAARPVYRVRGHLASDGTRRFFEPSRCTFIHRTPDAGQAGAANRYDDDIEKVRTRVVTQGKVCPDPTRPWLHRRKQPGMPARTSGG
jgi:uncharacterized protein